MTSNDGLGFRGQKLRLTEHRHHVTEAGLVRSFEPVLDLTDFVGLFLCALLWVESSWSDDADADGELDFVPDA